MLARKMLLSVLTLSLAGTALADVTAWNEPSSGDLSNVGSTPTNVALTPGVNAIFAVTGGGDRDYFRFTIGAGQTLTAITPVTYSGADGRMFIGLQSGSQVTVDPNNASPGPLLGYTHFGPSSGNVGTNILASIGTGAGSIGFTGALGPGTYSVWLQQLGSASTYQLNLTVTPAPSAGVLLAGGALVATRRRRV
jgi:hypothetical protein